MNPDLPGLEGRLARLEKQNRLFRALLAAVAVMSIVAASQPADAISASGFRLLDEQGRVRAELAIREGAPGLYILHEEGRDRLVATHDAAGTGLYLKDEEGHSRVGVAQFAHGGGGVALHGPGARGAAVLYFKGEGSLRFFDEEGKVTNKVGAREEVKSEDEKE